MLHTIFIRNYSERLSRHDLEDYFRRFGSFKSLVSINSHASGKPLCLSFLQGVSSKTKQTIFNSAPHTLLGRTINISLLPESCRTRGHMTSSEFTQRPSFCIESVHPKTSTKTLKQHFSKYGAVEILLLGDNDPNSPEADRFGILKFLDENFTITADICESLENDVHHIDGRDVVIHDCDCHIKLLEGQKETALVAKTKKIEEVEILEYRVRNMPESALPPTHLIDSEDYLHLTLYKRNGARKERLQLLQKRRGTRFESCVRLSKSFEKNVEKNSFL